MVTVTALTIFGFAAEEIARFPTTGGAIWKKQKGSSVHHEHVVYSCYLLPSSSVCPTCTATAPSRLPPSVDAYTVTLYSVLMVRPEISREVAFARRLCGLVGVPNVPSGWMGSYATYWE